MKKSRQSDAHCRARERLLRRIIDRAWDWGVARPFRAEFKRAYPDPVERSEAMNVEMRRRATLALADYDWSDNWTMRQTGRYHPFGGYDGPKVPYRDVPVFAIHNIVCRMNRVAKEKEQAS